MLYDVNRMTAADPGGRFVFSQGDTTGYGFHGDFINGVRAMTRRPPLPGLPAPGESHGTSVTGESEGRALPSL